MPPLILSTQKAVMLVTTRPGKKDQFPVRGSILWGRCRMSADDPKLLREKAAQCEVFARSARLPDVAEMLSRLAESFLARALRAEQDCGGHAGSCAYP
jgi:hypothetical protein